MATVEIPRQTAALASERTEELLGVLAEKVLVLDGATGTGVQAGNLSAEDFGGPELEGCNENLVFTRPDVVRDLHASYFEAGADMVETDTFGATPLVLAEYGLARRVALRRAAECVERRLAEPSARELDHSEPAEREAGRPREVYGQPRRFPARLRNSVGWEGQMGFHGRNAKTRSSRLQLWTPSALFIAGFLTAIASPSSAQTILPVVGSTPGARGTYFRTSVQLHNPGTTPSSGGIVFHPSGTPGNIGDPTLFFTLAPGETRTIPDLLPAMGISGLGSADVIPTLGSAGNVPVVLTRVFNDAGAGGTSGFTLPAVRPEEALQAGEKGILLIPPDLTAYRMNMGVRTLDAATSLTFTVRDPAGPIGTVITLVFPPTYHEQQDAFLFLASRISTPFPSSFDFPAGGSVTVAVNAGAAILYGATVDNRTGDPSIQVARAEP